VTTSALGAAPAPARAGTPGPRTPSTAKGTWLYLTAGTLIGIIFLSPLLWAILQSFEPSAAFTQPPALSDFGHLSLANYKGLISGRIHILHYAFNSFWVSAGAAVLTAFLSLLAGYGFGRFRFRGSNIVFALTLVALMIPFQAVLTPLFLELHAMHLTNSLVGLLLFYATYNLPFGVFVMRNTFSQIPDELEDSAQVDGAGVIGTLWRVMRPLVLPGVATTLIYTFLFSWTEFLGALTFLTTDSKYTLPVALLNIETGTYGAVNYGYLVAGAVIAMIPVIILYVSLQRYYVQGLISGAVKG
jgi:multiple sugar transport system permease protein